MKIKATAVRFSRIVKEYDDAGLKMVPTEYSRIELLCDGVVISYYDIMASLADTVAADFLKAMRTGEPQTIETLSMEKIVKPR